MEVTDTLTTTSLPATTSLLRPLESPSKELSLLSLRAFAATAHSGDPLNVTSAVGEHLRTLLSAHSERVVAIDCFGVRSAIDHSLTSTTSSQLDRPQGVLFYNCEPDLVGRLMADAQKGHPPLLKTSDSGQSLWFKGKASRSLKKNWVKETITHCDDLRKSAVKAAIAGCFQSRLPTKRLPSTPLKSTGAFDLWRLLADPQDTIWLADEMDRTLQAAWRASCEAPSAAGPRIDPGTTPRLLAVNLRGSVLAYAILRFGGGWYDGLDLVDRFGPMPEPVERYDADPHGKSSVYLLVTDFIVAGSELKLADAYCADRDCLMPIAVCAGAVLKPADYGSRVRVAPCCQLCEVQPSFRLEL